MHHVIDNHVGTFSLYKTLSHTKMSEVEKKKREREEARYSSELVRGRRASTMSQGVHSSFTVVLDVRESFKESHSAD